MIIRDERPTEIVAIRDLITSAFALVPRSSGRESTIVEMLRANGALSISLVADVQGDVVGHVAFSPVTINGLRSGWYGLGPVCVGVHMQRRGIGEALIKAGLQRLEAEGAQGCVVLGNPGYYRRFGFENDPELRLPGAPEAYFQRLCLRGDAPGGIVEYHRAFS